MSSARALAAQPRDALPLSPPDRRPSPAPGLTDEFAAGGGTARPVPLFVVAERIQAALLALSDRFGLGLALFDACGELRHVSPGLASVLRSTAVAPKLRGALMSAAVRVLDGDVGPAAGGGPPPESLQEIVAVGDRRFRLRVVPAPGELEWLQIAVVVLVEDVQPVTDEVAAAWRRFGFTDRELEVARLLARGVGTADIAERLSVSHHTARRHTERIAAKLGAHSRAQVTVALLSQAPVSP